MSACRILLWAWPRPRFCTGGSVAACVPLSAPWPSGTRARGGGESCRSPCSLLCCFSVLRCSSSFRPLSPQLREVREQVPLLGVAEPGETAAGPSALGFPSSVPLLPRTWAVFGPRVGHVGSSSFGFYFKGRVGLQQWGAGGPRVHGHWALLESESPSTPSGDRGEQGPRFLKQSCRRRRCRQVGVGV